MPGLAMKTSSEPVNPPSFSKQSTQVDDTIECIAVMVRQETTTYKLGDYMDRADSSGTALHKSEDDDCAKPDPGCRVKMCEWCYQVADYCKFKRETVATSMSYLDRFLSTYEKRQRANNALHDRKDYQLAAMTSLYIAIKLFEPMAMDAELLSAISHGCYSEDDIVEMEQEILTALSWRVNGPTAHDFLNHIISLLPDNNFDEKVTKTILDFSRFQVEVAVCDYDLALQKPSAVALAAILNAVESIDEELFSKSARFDFFGFIFEKTKLEAFSKEVNLVRARLLDLFAKNSGYDLPQTANLTPIFPQDEEQFIITEILEKRGASFSPISVSENILQVDISSYAKCA